MEAILCLEYYKQNAFLLLFSLELDLASARSKSLLEMIMTTVQSSPTYQTIRQFLRDELQTLCFSLSKYVSMVKKNYVEIRVSRWSGLEIIHFFIR